MPARITNVSKFLLTLVLMFPTNALSRVIVHDTVVVKGEKVMLRAETKGKLFGKGGELVEFFVDGKSIGKNLSGGDGVAYKGYTPAKADLYEITARAGGEEDTGLLLALERGTGIVFIDIEGALFEDAVSLFSNKIRQGSRKAIEEIQERFPVVFLKTGFLSTKVMKSWLREEELVALPILPWEDGKIFHKIVSRGLKIKAIIAGPDVIESAGEQEPMAFSFEKAKDAEKVSDWEEVADRLAERLEEK